MLVVDCLQVQVVAVPQSVEFHDLGLHMEEVLHAQVDGAIVRRLDL